VAAVIGLAVLTAGVVTGVVHQVDVTVRDLARPGDVWGLAQWRADAVVEALRPSRAVWGPVAVAAWQCLRRRTIRPAVLVAAACLVAVALVTVIKLLVANPDPHGGLTHGGSFPSGHTLAVAGSAGLALLLVRAEPPWPAWALPAGLALVMGSALLVEGAHWGSDVLGGALLATALLAATAATGAPRWAGQPGRGVPAARDRSDGEPGGPERGGSGAGRGADDQAGQPRRDGCQGAFPRDERDLDPGRRCE
jgi:undecaprenyl-diphosphatase